MEEEAQPQHLDHAQEPARRAAGAARGAGKEGSEVAATKHDAEGQGAAASADDAGRHVQAS